MHTDILSDKARQILRLNVEEAFRELLPRETGSVDAADVLHAVSPGDLMSGVIGSHDDAACVLSALWLWHDYLDESHTICQSIETPSGSYWHAILHRREGDFGNAKYWYAQAGAHPIMPSLAIQANELINRAPADKALLRLTINHWNGPAFVDLVQQVHESPSDSRHALAVALQQLEWRVLFDHCVRGISKNS
jgi:hypothetical protein